MMNETEFWHIVEEILWPQVHYGEAKYRFMRRYPPEVAEEFGEIFLRKKAELRKAGRVEAVSDGWDDTLAHIVGLGKAEYERNIADPALMYQREESLDYTESFAYCIPFRDDYKLLQDDGYEPYLRSIRKMIDRIETTDSDDVPPREYRRYPELRALGELFLTRDWRRAVDTYHESYGPGYADTFPIRIAGYAIPNLVQNLERFRLRDAPRSEQKS